MGGKPQDQFGTATMIGWLPSLCLQPAVTHCVAAVSGLLRRMPTVCCGTCTTSLASFLQPPVLDCGGTAGPLQP